MTPFPNAPAIVMNPSSLSSTSAANRSCRLAYCSLFLRISRMTPCVRAQFGHCASFSARHLLRASARREGGREKDEPLVIGMPTHEVHAGEVELASACRAASDLEDARDVRVCELENLLLLLVRFDAVRFEKPLILLTSVSRTEGRGESDDAPNRSLPSQPSTAA